MGPLTIQLHACHTSGRVFLQVCRTGRSFTFEVTAGKDGFFPVPNLERT